MKLRKWIGLLLAIMLLAGMIPTALMEETPNADVASDPIENVNTSGEIPLGADGMASDQDQQLLEQHKDELEEQGQPQEEEPDPEQPDPEQPDPEQPDPEQPDVEDGEDGIETIIDDTIIFRNDPLIPLVENEKPTPQEYNGLNVTGAGMLEGVYNTYDTLWITLDREGETLTAVRCSAPKSVKISLVPGQNEFSLFIKDADKKPENTFTITMTTTKLVEKKHVNTNYVLTVNVRDPYWLNGVGMDFVTEGLEMIPVVSGPLNLHEYTACLPMWSNEWMPLSEACPDGYEEWMDTAVVYSVSGAGKLQAEKPTDSNSPKFKLVPTKVSGTSSMALTKDNEYPRAVYKNVTISVKSAFNKAAKGSGAFPEKVDKPVLANKIILRDEKQKDFSIDFNEIGRMWSVKAIDYEITDKGELAAKFFLFNGTSHNCKEISDFSLTAFFNPDPTSEEMGTAFAHKEFSGKAQVKGAFGPNRVSVLKITLPLTGELEDVPFLPYGMTQFEVMSLNEDIDVPILTDGKKGFADYKATVANPFNIAAEITDLEQLTINESEEKKLIYLVRNRTTTLRPGYIPENASFRSLLWTSSNSKYLTVNDGDIKALKVPENGAPLTITEGSAAYPNITAQIDVLILDANKHVIINDKSSETKPFINSEIAEVKGGWRMLPGSVELNADNQLECRMIVVNGTDKPIKNVGPFTLSVSTWTSKDDDTPLEIATSDIVNMPVSAPAGKFGIAKVIVPLKEGIDPVSFDLTHWGASLKLILNEHLPVTDTGYQYVLDNNGGPMEQEVLFEQNRVSEIRVFPGKLILAPNKKNITQLQAQIIPENPDEAPTWRYVRWETSDPNVVTVSADGVVSTKKAGKAVIYAYDLDNAGNPGQQVFGQCQVEVWDKAAHGGQTFVPAKSITSDNSMQFETNASTPINVFFTPENVSVRELAWRVVDGDKDKIHFGFNENNQMNVVAATAAGNYTFEGATIDGSQLSVRITAKVSAPAPATEIPIP